MWTDRLGSIYGFAARVESALFFRQQRPRPGPHRGVAHAVDQLASTLRRDGIELRIARDIGQFRDVMRSAVPEAFHHEVFRTIEEAINAAPEAGRDGPPDATRP